MKCPNCLFVCSDLRDLCPQCTVDLRPHKQTIGLKVTHPGLSYEQLLVKSGAKSTKPDPSTPKAPSFFQRLLATSHKESKPHPQTTAQPKIEESSLKKSKEVAPQITPTTETPNKVPTQATATFDDAPILEPAPQDPLVLREAVRVSAAPEVMDLSELDDSALDQMLGGVEGSAIETIAAPSASSEATPSEELVSVEFELDALTPSPQESEPSRPETIITTAQEIIPQVQQFEGLGPDVVLMVTPMEVFDSRTGILTPYPAEHSAEHTDALPGNHIPDESFLPPLPTELVSVASPVEMLPSPFSSFEAAHIDPAIAALFGEAEIEVPDLTSAIEVSLDQLGTYTDSEDMKLLFDMAEEALLDPTIEKLFERSIIPSEQRHVQASSLLKQLKETEKQLTAPFLSLKNLARRKSKTSATATDSTAPETSAKTPRAHVIPAGSALMTPGAFGYLGGFAIDMTLMVILALVVAINIDLSKDGATGTTLLLGEIPTTLDLILFASRTLIVFLGVAIAYPLLTTLLAKSTPGALVGRYYFIREDGRPIRFGECLIRALLYPLSLIGVGPLAYILLRRPLHDYLAGVILIRREAP